MLSARRRHGGWAGHHVVPDKFSSGCKESLLGEANALIAQSVVSQTQKDYSAIALRFVKFCGALDLEVECTFETLAAWAIHYCGQGFSARSLPGHYSALRWWAAVVGLVFLDRTSAAWKRLGRVRRALALRDPTEKVPCSPLTADVISTMMAADGFVTVRDFRLAARSAARLGAFLFWLRLLVGHACMLRLCELEDGMSLADLTLVPASRPAAGAGEATHGFYVLRAGFKEPEVLPFAAFNRKLRFKPTRECVMPIDASRICAATLLSIYFDEVRSPRMAGRSDVVLFASACRGVLVEKPLTGKEFLAAMRVRASAAGVPAGFVSLMHNRSLRAGGCVDYFRAGFPRWWVMRQGGWVSDAIEDYLRPSPAQRAALFWPSRAAFGFDSLQDSRGLAPRSAKRRR